MYRMSMNMLDGGSIGEFNYIAGRIVVSDKYRGERENVD